MATLQELAGNIGGRQKQASMSISGTGGSGVQASSYKAESIAGDVLGILNEGGKIRQTHNTLSVGVAKRNVVSSLVERNAKLSEVMIEAEKPGADYRAISQSVDDINKYYGQAKYDNADAQQAFDEGYHVKGFETIFNTRDALEKKAFKQDADNLYKQTIESVEILVPSGEYTEDIHKTLVESVSSTGDYYTEDQLNADVASIIAVDFDQTAPENFISEGGVVNEQAVKDYVDIKLGRFVKFNEDGALEWLTDDEGIKKTIGKQLKVSKNRIESTANTTQNEYVSNAKGLARASLYEDRPWIDENGISHKHVGTAKNFQRLLTAKFPELTKADNLTVMNMYHDKKAADTASLGADVNDWVYRNKVNRKDQYGSQLFVSPKVINKLDGELNKLLNNPNLTKTQRFNLEHAYKDTMIVATNNNEIQSQITALDDGTMTVQDAKGNVDNGTLNKDGKVITKAQYKGMYSQAISTLSDDIKGSTIDSAEASVEFAKKLTTLKKFDLANGGSGSPKLFQTYDGVLKDRTNIYNMSSDDIGQFVSYMDYQFTANPEEYGDYAINVKQLKNYIDTQAKDETTDQATKDMHLRTFTANALKWKVTPSNAKSMWGKAMENVATGSGYTWTMQNTEGASNVTNVLQSMYSGSYLNQDKIDSFVGNYEFYDTSGRYNLIDNQRILIPKSMESHEVTKLLEYHTKAEGITANDIELIAYEHLNKDGSKGLGYNVMYKSNDGSVIKRLGVITHDAYNKIK